MVSNRRRARAPAPLLLGLETKDEATQTGRRTAWSSAVVVGGITYQARYFYHGDFIDNAREDAAEVALRALSAQQSAPVPSLPTLHATQPMPQYGRIQG